jgi:predicted LPLAT superfamily acyltransferase
MKEDLSHVYEIGEALLRNELICLHADRFVDEAKTLEMNFFNQKALFPVGPFALAATFKVPVSFVFSFKETLRHYHFYGSPIIDYDSSLAKSDYIKYMATQFAELFEKMVKKYPFQWFNYYKFEK